MRLPRRHPFASHGGQAEVSHLYALFYPSAAVPHYEADAQRAHGVHLVQSLYLAKGGCPVAIECTSSLVSSLLLDHQLTGHAAVDAGPLTPPPAISLAVRQTLTLSLIRLVNTLADSLQKGAFARSIASIAERELGLPQWFVEFRHRGTHEELPSLEICREVVGSALAWIEGAYWLPTLRDAERRRVRALDRRSQGSTSDLTGAFQLPEKPKDASAQVQHPSGSGSTLLFPSSASQVASSSLTPAEKLQRNHTPTLHGILRNYKRLSKLLVRDESLRGRSRAEMHGIYRDLDNWVQAARRDVGEGYRTTTLTRGMNQSGSRRQVGWANEDEDESDSEQDEESRGNVRPGDPTLDCLIRVLLSSTEGVGLIPLSKNKRAKRARGQEEGGEALPSLPEELLMAWSGLLNHLGKGDPAGEFSFIESWLQSMIELLLGTSVTAQGDLAESPGTQMDTSSRLTLLAWIRFILDALSFTATPPSGPPASANDEVISLRLCICARLLRSRSGKDHEQDKEKEKQEGEEGQREKEGRAVVPDFHGLLTGGGTRVGTGGTREEMAL
ncbi:Las1-domain-containing protein [Microstroma glucosiphilum]|uniref:Las1-domain-containing protein n=1 Tax=Pseudomicrostroma glucosiphilum TaxID=1684307 RepID=A0A316U471_9BASI|nr:Las1-domain-containing protein [Pseudomicrostroma glucosiphilum]PWN19564.1 Las1-domain-containing protein [Pseudomicrostroma glucosiphilum]